MAIAPLLPTASQSRPAQHALTSDTSVTPTAKLEAKIIGSKPNTRVATVISLGHWPGEGTIDGNQLLWIAKDPSN